MNQPIWNAYGPTPMAMDPHQTTFGYGHDHFSLGHANHRFGSTDPIQRDFGLNMPNGHFKPLVGVGSPSGMEFQTKLPDFKIF